MGPAGECLGLASVPSEIRSRSLPSLVKIPHYCLSPLPPGNVPAHCFPLGLLCDKLRGCLQPSQLLLLSLDPSATPSYFLFPGYIMCFMPLSVHMPFPLLGMLFPFCPPGKLLLIHQNPAQIHLPCLPLTHFQISLSHSLFHKMCVTGPPRARHCVMCWGHSSDTGPASWIKQPGCGGREVGGTGFNHCHKNKTAPSEHKGVQKGRRR